MMGRRFARIVEECLHRLDRGEDLPDVLADFPDEVEYLKPLLLVAMASRSMSKPTPSQAAHHLGRNHMLSAMDQLGSSPISNGSTFYYRIRKWSTRMVHNLRAQYLIRRAPSYRLAIIALLVVFGSGWFALTASASPGDLITAIVADFQGVIKIFSRQPAEESQDFNYLFTIFSGNNSPFTGKQPANAAFQQDLPGDSDTPEPVNNTAGKNPTSSSHQGDDPDGLSGEDPPPEDSPDAAPSYLLDQDPDLIDSSQPYPFPGNAVDVVEEMVSDTAVEKNPVWDQLPFNQTEQDATDDTETLGQEEDQDDDQDQDPDDEKIKDNKPAKLK